VKTSNGDKFGQKKATLDCRKMQSKKLHELFLFTKRYWDNQIKEGGMGWAQSMQWRNEMHANSSLENPRQ
jgi:hypothetical protein